MNIVIPMAGAGSRFAQVGYTDPKPLISVKGVPMIKVVIDNLKSSVNSKFTFICQNKHIAEYGLESKLKEWAPNCNLVGIDGITEGAACTVLIAQDFFNSDEPLMIANSDQFIDIEIDNYINKMNDESLDGIIMTMTANDPKWSYVKIDNNNLVTEVVEKKVISNEATVGIYNFKSGKDFIIAANEMISNNDRTNNEFYVAPVYNYLIKTGAKIGYYNIGSEGNGMYGLGTPSDLESFLSNPISEKI